MYAIKKLIVILLLFFISHLISVAFAVGFVVAETVVILNNNNPASSLNLNELNRIFTGKKKHWKNGEQIVIFLPEVGSCSYNALSVQVFNKNDPAAIPKFYLKAVFQQKFAFTPTVSTAPVIDIIENKGGIALVDRQQLPINSKVKIVKVEGL